MGRVNKKMEMEFRRKRGQKEMTNLEGRKERNTERVERKKGNE